ncbi:MAG: hypothetical protein FJ265_03545 [Planctomycetes bacterium]|nr:hypothetical protein [Planctomycetota bacterium]
MELRDAIDQITTIRTQLAATERLRGLRAVPVALSGAMAIAAAVAQGCLIQHPLAEPARYLLLWTGTALLAGAFAAVEVVSRTRRSDSALGTANLRLAALQFAPSLLAGAVVTIFVATRLPGAVALLPGLWQLLFGLGNLAAQQVLPAPARAVGLCYLGSGGVCLWLGERALDPWAMGLPFAVGQFALAAILWWHHERSAPAEVRP